MRVVCQILLGLVFVIIGIAAVGKLIDLATFRTSLETWKTIPQSGAAIIAIVVPLCEISLVMFFVQRPTRRAVHIGTLVFLLVITLGFIAEAVVSGTVECNCLGLILQQEAWMTSFWGVLIRNTVMMLVLALWLVVSRRTETKMKHAKNTSERTSSLGVRAGFTLIELIVVVAIIGIIVGLALPALGHMKREAKRASTLSHLRQHAATIQMYSSDWKDSVPSIIRSHDQPYYVESKEQTVGLSNLYFRCIAFWNIALADGYFDSRFRGSDFQTVNAYAGRLGTNLILSPSLIASPSYWTPERDTNSLRELRPVRMGMCRFPSAKVMMLDEWEFFEERLEAQPKVIIGGTTSTPLPPPPPLHMWRTSIALMDGSARRTVGTEWVEPTQMGAYHPMLSGSGPVQPLMHTLNGVLGRDLK